MDTFRLGASATGAEFCERIKVETDVYISHCEYQVKPHSHGFQLLALLP